MEVGVWVYVLWAPGSAMVYVGQCGGKDQERSMYDRLCEHVLAALAWNAAWFGTTGAFTHLLLVHTERTYVAGPAACGRGPGRSPGGGGGHTLIYGRRDPL